MNLSSTQLFRLALIGQVDWDTAMESLYEKADTDLKIQREDEVLARSEPRETEQEAA